MYEDDLICDRLIHQVTCCVSGEAHLDRRVRGHQGDQAGAGRRLRHHPAGDPHDEGTFVKTSKDK